MPNMATVERRRKMITYGKASRRPLPTFNADDASPEPRPAKTMKRAARPQMSTDRPTKQPSKLVRPSPKKATLPSRNIFDLPSADEEADPRPTTSMRARPSPARALPLARHPKIVSSPGQETATDETTASKKRKRASPDVVAPKQEEKPRAKQVTGKVRAKPDIYDISSSEDESPARTVRRITPVKAKWAQAVPTASKAVAERRTKRTTLQASSTRKPLTAGSSAPAQLQKMVSTADEELDTGLDGSRDVDFERMSTPQKSSSSVIEVEPSTPPVAQVGRTQGSPAPRSVTPRQKLMWSTLLDSDATATPGTLGMSRLKITGRPGRPQAKLARSSSEVPQTVHTRRVRLVDTLKQSQVMGDEDDSMEESELESEALDSSDLITADDGGGAAEMDMDTEPALAPIANVGPKFTYSAQRTYLQEEDPEAELNMLLDGDTMSYGQSQNSGKGFSQSQPDDYDDPDDMGESQGAIRSIHELRAAGRNRRFEQAFENLLDDVKDDSKSATSRRRSAMLELCTKLAEKDYVVNIVNQGLDARLLAACEVATETIFNFALAAGLAFLADAGVSLIALQHVLDSSCVNQLVGLLNLDKDISIIAKDRKMNMSRVGQSTLSDFRTLVIGHSIWSGANPDVLSPRIMALKSLEVLIRKLREGGSTDDFLDERLVQKLVDMAAQSSNSDFLTTEICLSILESGSVASSRTSRKSLWTPQLHRQFATQLVPRLLHPSTDSGRRTENLALRLSLNLTNNSAKISDIFAQPDLIHTLVESATEKFSRLSAEEMEEDVRTPLLDALLVTLGMLINLSEFSDTARVAVLSPCSSTSASSKGAGSSSTANAKPAATPSLATTAKAKAGKAPTSYLITLTKSFLDNREAAHAADSLSASHLAVAYGYLAVLLANLCLNKKVHQQLLELLPGKKLDVLVGAVEEFVSFNRRVDMEMSAEGVAGGRAGDVDGGKEFEGDEGREVWVGYTQRLEGVVARLKGLVVA
ncbi:hypothetical protein K402DRAFT_96676 [Aulographum hederae CBS 113979]|uniref:Wings apart-like protein C-terminal domain-containing protein n=1 Tax=Aulographum hederae CBS 113979 TaxID=1176131 RepID=A0A6G1GYD7_9PEZI|nr:hypothetical protein K402DRAFT_96676 [Aulographum hederae CBS 113979]